MHCSNCFETFSSKKAFRTHKCPVGSPLNLTMFSSNATSDGSTSNLKLSGDEEENEEIEISVV
jgi:hypothetical protein